MEGIVRAGNDKKLKRFVRKAFIGISFTPLPPTAHIYYTRIAYNDSICNFFYYYYYTFFFLAQATKYDVLAKSDVEWLDLINNDHLYRRDRSCTQAYAYVYIYTHSSHARLNKRASIAPSHPKWFWVVRDIVFVIMKQA